jgi:hypothetical protein
MNNNLEAITVWDALGFDFLKNNPIKTEARTILNKLFENELGFFDEARANRIEWWLPKEIKNMLLFVKGNNSVAFSNVLIEASNGYGRIELCENGKYTETKFNFFITSDNKEFLKKAIVEFENSTNKK